MSCCVFYICIFIQPESARAVTGRQCPQGGVGEDFLAVFFFTKTAQPKNKVLRCFFPLCGYQKRGGRVKAKMGLYRGRGG